MADVLNQKDLPVLRRSEVVAKPQQKELTSNLESEATTRQ